MSFSMQILLLRKFRICVGISRTVIDIEIDVGGIEKFRRQQELNLTHGRDLRPKAAAPVPAFLQSQCEGHRDIPSHCAKFGRC